MLPKHIGAIAFGLFTVSTLFCLADADSGVKVTASSDHQWTGVAVSDQGRVFVNYPYWSEEVPVSVAEIVDGRAIPYPSPEWNDRQTDEYFNAVQSVVIDAKNRLWVLDTNNPQFKGVKAAGPVLFQVDLKTNRKIKAFPFPAGVYQPNSYFNDVRIDTKKEVAYLTDSGNGALIVLNLTTGRSRRLLEGHPSVQSETDYLACDGAIWENSVDADGIALTPNGSTLYYIALTGHTLYRISTDALRDESLSAEELARHVDRVAAVPATDGMLFDREGNLWLGGLENNAINRLDPAGKLIRVLQDPAIRWADSFAMDKAGTLYFTTSQIHLPEQDRGPYQVLSFQPEQVQAQKNLNKILIAVTSHGTLGAEAGEPTGYYLSEVSHAYYAFKAAGFAVDFTSPRGGPPPVDGQDVEDDENTRFLNDATAQQAIRNSIPASRVNATAYRAVYYAGGHGVMWDFADDKNLQNISRRIYETGGVVSAVCHGPAGLVNIRLSNGRFLVDGKRVSTFTNAEEAAVKLDKTVPFALESKLIERGAEVVKADPFLKQTVVDQRLVTGQNPASAKEVAAKTLHLLGSK